MPFCVEYALKLAKQVSASTKARRSVQTAPCPNNELYDRVILAAEALVSAIEMERCQPDELLAKLAAVKDVNSQSYEVYLAGKWWLETRCNC